MSARFKQTEIGEIPEDWDVRTLVNAIGMKNDLIVAGPFGSNLKVKDYKDEGIPIIRLQNIEFGRFINKDIKYISPEKAEELNYHSFSKGDLVLAKLGDPIGKTCIIPDFLEKGIVVSDVVRIRVNEQFLDKKYIMQILNSFYVSKQLNNGIIGTTRPRVNLDQVRTLLIPVPPLHEQRRIANILSTVDEAIEETDNIVKACERVKKGLMQTLLIKGLPGKHTKFKETKIGNIPEDWDIKHIIDFCYIKGRLGWKGLRKNEFTKEGPFLITGTDFEDGAVNWDTSFHITMERYLESPEIMVKEGDILITKDGTIGKTAFIDYLPGMASLNSHLLLVRPNNHVNPRFLFYILQSDRFVAFTHQQKAGSTLSGLSQRKFEKFLVPIASILEQNEIVKIISTLDSRIKSENQKKSRLETLKKGLMQVLLTGKVRVKVD